MGSAGCGCNPRNIDSVIPQKLVKINYHGKKEKMKPSISELQYSTCHFIEGDNENFLDYHYQLNMSFCKEYSIGPFLLQDMPNLFDKNYTKSSTSKLKLLLKKIEYSTAIEKRKQSGSRSNSLASISSTCESGINYDLIMESKNLSKLKSLQNEEICDILLYGNSQFFRSTLYLILLNSNVSSQFHLNEKNNLSIDEEMKIKAQIECDIPRTFPKCNVLKSELFINNLRCVLFEIALRDTELSYVQGMNFIISFILMLTGNQKQLTIMFFFKLINMNSKKFKVNFKHVLTEDFSLLRCYITALKDILFNNNKELYDHLQSLEIDEWVWMAKWIQTLFVMNFRFELAIKFWDIFISHGADSILLIISGMLDFFRETLVKTESIEDFLEKVNTIYNLEGYEYSSLINHILNLMKSNEYL